MHWLALYLPTLLLDAVVDAQPAAALALAKPDASLHAWEGQQPPLCVIEAGRIQALSIEAEAVGAHIGMSFAAASSLAPGLIAVPRDTAREEALVHRLSLALSRYTPSLVIEPHGLRLELSSTLRLFGGIKPLLRAARATVSQCGVEHVRFAQASTATAASLLARLRPEETKAEAGRHASNFEKSALTVLKVSADKNKLDPAPLAAVMQIWNQPRHLVELLQGIGCQTLGQLRALPRNGFTRRGGGELMSLVARTYGDEPDPQTWFEPPPDFELGFELLHRADDAPSLVFAAQRLVQPLVGWLALRWLAVSRLSLKLRHESSRYRDQPDSVLQIALAEPSRDAAQIMLLLRERLHRMTLPAPVYALTLRLDDAVSHAGRASALWPSPNSRHENERVLIDRLSARLGHDRVLRVQACADHRPERATRWVSAQQQLTEASAAETARRAALPCNVHGKVQAGAPRPPWLLDQPLPLREAANRPLHEGKPLTLVSRAERIEAGWVDGALASRDYHVAATDSGCYWIYRERRANAPARWYLHGFFG